MALKIINECICCDACVPVCPVEAIECDDPIYVIESSLCTECVGYFKEPQCVEACPVDAIVVDEDLAETKKELTEKFKKNRQK